MADRRHVAAICAAQLKFQEAGDDLQDDLTEAETEEDAVELLLPPMRELVDDFKSANPPDDAEEYHNILVDSFEDVVNTLEDTKSITALDELEDPPDPPADISARFDDIAADNQDCIDAGFTFSE